MTQAIEIVEKFQDPRSAGFLLVRWALTEIDLARNPA